MILFFFFFRGLNLNENMGFSGSPQTSQCFIMMILTIILFFSSSTVAHISSVSDDDSLFSTHNSYPPENFLSATIAHEGPKEGSLLQNFRLKSFLLRRPIMASNGNHIHNNNHYISPSPSPSPYGEAGSTSLSPSQAPTSHIHVKNPHPERHAFHSLPRPQTAQRDEKGKAKRVLIAVLVSLGGVTLVGVVFLVLAWNKYRKCHKKPKKRRFSVPWKRRDRSNRRLSSSKVSLNPGLDLLYLDSLGKDLEKQSQACETVVETQQSPNATLFEREESTREPAKPELFDNVSTSSTREITSVHEDIESVDEENDCSTKIVPIEESHSSDDDDEEENEHSNDDDQSFHSLVESNSSMPVRLSDASLGSFSDAMENFNSSELNPSLSTAIKPSISTRNTFSNPNLESPSQANDVKSEATNFSTPPPPPPPPPPLPRPNFLLPSRLSASSSTRNDSIASSSSSTLPSPSPPKEQSKTLQLNEHFASSPMNKPSNPGIVPTPPCPPPLFKPNSNSLKTPPPPPPPSQLPQFSPLGKDGSPLPKLKPLHWDKVRAAPDRSMVWDKLRSSSFEFDEEMIESLFGYNLQNSMKSDEAKSKTPSPSKHVLEPKRLQNITILSKALNVTSDQVCEALLQGKGLSLQQLEALVKMAPTKEEEAKLSGYRGNIDELGSAEKFVRAMLDIPLAFQRVEAMLYRESFEDEVVHIKNSFSMLEEACMELRSSRLFLKLLEAVLKTGNRMNVGTIRGGARAFKLDALLKLADVKGTDGKATLLHFVVQEIVRSEGVRVSHSIMGRIDVQKNKARTPDEKEDDYRRMGLDLVSGLSTELYNVKKTAAVDLDVLASSVSNLSEGMARLRGLVASDVVANVGFAKTMRSFLGYAEKRLEEIKGDEDGVMARVREVTEYFHGNSNVGKEEANPLRIFVIVRDFLGMLDHVCKELRSSKTPRSPNPLAPFR